MKELIKSLINLLFSIAEFITIFFFRPLWKWLAHLYTNQCELERIIFNNKLSNYDKNELIGRFRKIKHTVFRNFL